MIYKSNTIKDVGSGQAPSFPSQVEAKVLGQEGLGSRLYALRRPNKDNHS